MPANPRAEFPPPFTRGSVLLLGAFLAASVPFRATALEPLPEKLVVLTFDDSIKSHATVVGPLLKKHGFGATFFITEGFDFRDNKRDYMTWAEIQKLHDDGFEIGNHTRDHFVVNANNVDRLREQVEAITVRCREHGIPDPVSFAYPGNGIDVKALPILQECGIRWARRGGAPEYDYKEGDGPAYQPGKDHPLLIPTTIDARPFSTASDIVSRIHRAHRNQGIPVVQFHGTPDTAHQWVNFPREEFESLVDSLANGKYTVIALRDLAKYVDPRDVPRDPMAVIAARSERRRMGKTILHPLDGAEMIYVPSGEFVMGLDRDEAAAIAKDLALESAEDIAA